MNTEILNRLRDSVPKPALQSHNETRSLCTEGKGRLQASHMRFLRHLTGVAQRDRLSN
jgi:hypothetical protein